MKTELKPCPFCGKPPRTGEHRSSDESGETYGYSYIECCHGSSKAFAGVHADSLEECLEMWNTRSETR